MACEDTRSSRGIGYRDTGRWRRARAASPSEDLALIPLIINAIRHLFAKLTTNTVHHDPPQAGLVTLATPTPSTRLDHRLPTPPPHQHASTTKPRVRS